MIELKNIHLEESGRLIRATAFVESCKEPVELAMNRQGEWEREPVLPSEYSYCGSHIFHAKMYLEKLIGKKFETHNRLIMWY